MSIVHVIALAAIAVASIPDRAGAATNRQPAATGFRGEPPSNGVRAVTEWVIRSGDNSGLPFIIIDKVGATVFAFDGTGRTIAATAALIGQGRGDDSPAGIGKRRLSTIGPDERITPAGRFVASLGHDLEQDILWIDYESALSLHRIIRGKPLEHRAERLASTTPRDNRISFGCINVPAAFYDGVIVPAFKGTVGIVYILPETRPIGSVFDMPAASVRRSAAAR